MAFRPLAERVRQLLGYDPEAGVLTRIGSARPQSSHYVGKRAGHINAHGYSMVSVDGRNYRAHQIVWLLMTGEWPSTDIDHIDGDRTNNKWANLRPASRGQNLANATRLRPDNKSGIKGVSFDKARGKWKAQFGAYPNHYCGRFDTKEEAAAAYLLAAQSRYGEFARAVCV